LRQASATLRQQLHGLDGFVLPGSPADVDPARYGAIKHQKTNELDKNRDNTDIAILDHAFHEAKPVLAICYGCQLLNVYLQGTMEGVEWNGDPNWVVGVQWHPERMVGDPLAERLFADFVAAARQHLSREAHGRVAQKA